MGKINEILGRTKIPTPVYFIIAMVIIILLMPREDKDKYTYAENRPWRYGLLTAPFDFDIEKSKEKINLEKDSIYRSFQPYYLEDKNVERQAVNEFKQDAKEKNTAGIYTDYLEKKIRELYQTGIISSESYKKLQAGNKNQIRLKGENSITATRDLASFHTPKLAYEKILADMPSFLNLAELKSISLNKYLQANIHYDEKTSLFIQDELIREIPMYEGRVQSGEKIIDRGEIVDSRTFAILNSFVNDMGGRLGSQAHPIWLILGQCILVILLMMTLMTYLRFFRKREYYNKKNLVFILSQICFCCLITSLSIEYYKSGSILFTIPFAIPVILIRTFIDSRTAMMTHTITVLACALMLPMPLMAEFIFIQIMIGYVTIFSLKNLSERSQLIYTAIFILLAYIITYTAWVLSFEGDLTQLNPRIYFQFCINFVFITFSYLLVYVCEKTFGFISEVSMIELSNINRPLLQQLSEIAPGTFQHSMQVSNLVTAAAIRIGANAALVRTGALYHDIGKMKNPAFFTENQSPGMNPHAGLSYKESAKIIIEHVTEGVRIAKKYNLPQQIVDFIETHHGKGTAKFFYTSYKNEHPDEEVDIADFAYPGPNPFSRETALLMMADTVEAASRSLQEYTEESINSLINRLIDSQVNDGLFKNAPITFSDIELAKEVFCEKLMTIYHSRIAYPELKKTEK